MLVRKYLVWMHRWLGLPLAVLFLISFLSGMILSVDEIASRFNLVDPELVAAEQTFSLMPVEEKGHLMSRLLTGYEGVQAVVFPNEVQPIWSVRVGRQLSYHHPLTLQLVSPLSEGNGLISWALNLHKHYLLGKEGLFSVSGKYYVAWVGLLSLLLSVLGVWLWWKLRKSFAVKKMIPLGGKRKDFYYAHMHLGVVVFVAILGLTLTGAGMAYRDFSRALLVQAEPVVTAMFSEGSAKIDDGISVEDADWSRWLTTAQGVIDHGRLVAVRFPRKGVDVYEVRLSSDHGLGLPINSVSFSEYTGAVVSVKNARDMPVMEWLFHAMTALHTGRNLPVYYVFCLFVFSLLALIMLFSSLMSFIKKKRKAKRGGFRFLQVNGIKYRG